MQSTAEYLVRLAQYERECQSRAQVAVKSIEIVKLAINTAVTHIAFELSKRPAITRKEARLSRKRDFQANKALTVLEKDNILNLLRIADAAEPIKESQLVVKEVYSRKNSYLVGDTNLKSTFSLIAVQLYLDSMSQTGSLRTIDISGQGLGDKMIMKLMNQVQGSCIVELILANNKITDESLFRLSVVLPSLKSLENLNLSANNFKDNGIQAIFAPNIFPITLKHIDLSRNHLGLIAAYYIGSAFAVDTGAAAPQDVNNMLDISSLFLGGNLTTGHSLEFVRVLMSFLCRNRSPLHLRSLSLPSAGLESEGLSSISAFIACSRSISFMNISNNCFLSERSKAFCQSALLANKSLKHISVGKCNLNTMERECFQAATTLSSILSWRDRTSLSFQVGREFSKCAEARHTVEVNEFNLWHRVKPPEWPDSMYLSGDPPPTYLFNLPLDSKNVPALIRLSVQHLNEVWNGLIYLEQVLAKNYADDKTLSGFTLHLSLVGQQKAGLTTRELRLRADKMGKVKLQLLDYKPDSTSDGVVNPESMCMLIEDLLSTVVSQETAIARDIALWYTKKLQKKERSATDDAVSRRVSAASVASCTISAKYGSSQRGSIAPSQPPPPPRLSENDIPYYSYLGDAAVFVYYMCIVRHCEHEEEARASNKKEKLKHKKKQKLKVLLADLARNSLRNSDTTGIPTGVAKEAKRGDSVSSVGSTAKSVRSSRSARSARSSTCGASLKRASLDGDVPTAMDVQSALLDTEESAAFLDCRRCSNVSVSGGYKHAFAEADKDLFKKLHNLELGKDEGDRAVLSNSRTNQSKIVFECAVLPLGPDLGPDLGSNSEHDSKDFISFFLEEEAPRCHDKMMDLRTIDCTERAVVAIDHFRMAFKERLQRRKLNVL